MSDNINTVGKPPTCQHCGMIHDTTCPRIKAIEYHPDGSTKRIEFHSAPPMDIRSMVNLQAGSR